MTFQALNSKTKITLKKKFKTQKSFIPNKDYFFTRNPLTKINLEARLKNTRSKTKDRRLMLLILDLRSTTHATLKSNCRSYQSQEG